MTKKQEREQSAVEKAAAIIVRRACAIKDWRFDAGSENHSITMLLAAVEGYRRAVFNANKAQAKKGGAK